LQSNFSQSGMCDDYSLTDEVLQDEQRLGSGNLHLDSASSFGTPSDTEVLESRTTELWKSKRRFRGDSLSLPKGTPSRKIGSYIRHLNHKDCENLKFSSRRNISDSSISNTNLTSGRGLGVLKRTDSISSILSTSTSSECEESLSNNRVEYCPPLSVSLNSSPTNVRYCKDRQFFNREALDFNVAEEPHTPDLICVPATPKLEAADEGKSAYDLSDMPHFDIGI